MYKITRLFTSGILKGLTHTSITGVKFEEGFTCQKSVFGSAYEVIKVEEII